MGSSVPPTVSGLPLLGNVHQLVRPLAFGERCGTVDTPVVRARAGTESFYVVTSPTLLEEVLVSRAEYFEKPDLLREQLAASFGFDLEYDDPAHVSSIRDAWQPVVYADSIDTYRERIDGIVARTVADLPAGEPVDLLETSRRLCLAVVSATLFGVELDAKECAYSRLVDAINRKYAPAQLVQSLLVPEWVPTATNRRYRQAIADLERVVDQVFEEGRAGPLLAALERAREDGSTVTEASVRTEIGVLLVGAIEPLALALTYICACLASAPSVQERLRTTLAEHVGGSSTLADLRSVEYLSAVISESLRLYPPIYTMFRRTSRPVELGGYEIPSGARIWLSQWQLHRDDRHFDDPLGFDPDRWLGETEHPTYAYVPFGGGSRQCVGGSFAVSVCRLVLRQLLTRYAFEPTVSLPDPLAVTAEFSLVPAEPIDLVFRPLE